MSGSDDNIDAALWALGALTPMEAAESAKRLKSDPAFATQVSEWEELLAPLGDFAPSARPSERLLESIEGQLDARARLEALSRTLNLSEDNWIRAFPGVRLKVLHSGDEFGRQTVALDFEPGSVYPAHRHKESEEIYMISGDLIMGHVELGPGDFYVSPKGSGHPPSTTRGGCLCIVCSAI